MTLNKLSELRNYKRQIIKLLDEFSGVRFESVRRSLKYELVFVNDQIRYYLENGENEDDQ